MLDPLESNVRGILSCGSYYVSIAMLLLSESSYPVLHSMLENVWLLCFNRVYVLHFRLFVDLVKGNSALH